MQTFRTGIIGLTCLLSAYLATAQSQYVFSHLTATDGLGDEAVFNITQDRKGYVWIATTNGLNRYDGERMPLWTHQEQDSFSISSNNVRTVFEDADGYIWIGARDGKIDRFDPLTGIFKHYPLPETQPIWEFFQDRDGTIWIASHHQLYFLPRGGDQIFAHQQAGLDYKAFRPFSFAPHPHNQDQVFIGCRSPYLLLLTLGNRRIDTIPVRFAPDIGATGDLLSHGNQKIYSFTSPRYVMEYNPADGKIRHWTIEGEYNLSSAQVAEKSPHELWVATRSFGLAEIDFQSGKFRFSTHRSDLSHSIGPGSQYALMKDRDGHIWVGGEESGISILNAGLHYFQHFFLPKPKNPGREPLFVRQVALWDGAYWVAAENGDGLYRLGGDGTLLDVLNRPMPFEGRFDPTAMIPFDKNRILVGARQGLYFVRRDKPALQIVSGMADKEIIHLQEDGRDGAWGFAQKAGKNEVFHCSAQTLTSFSLPEPPENLRIHALRPSYFAVDTLRSVIWMGNAQWKGYFDLRDNQFHYEYGDRFQIVHGHSTVGYAAVLHDGGLWFSNFSNGPDLFRFSPDGGGDQERLKTRFGLPVDFTGSVTEPTPGLLLSTTNRGLLWLRLSDGAHGLLTDYEGLIRKNLNFKLRYAIHAFPHDHRVAIGGYGYFTVFDPALLFQPQTAQRPPVITGFEQLEDGQKSVVHAMPPEQITLRWDQNYFQIYFTDFNFAPAGRQSEYRYRLSGFDTRWNITREGRATYLKAPPGRYVFEVETADGQHTARLRIHIRPPWYKTIWFYTFFIILLFALIYWLYQFRVNTLLKQAQLRSEYKEKITLLELKALRNQINPHFIFNSLNSIKSYIALNERRTASDYLSNFAHLIRTILHHSNQTLITLEAELEAVNRYIQLEQMRFDKKLLYTLQIDQKVNPEQVSILPLTLQPFVENAIWHGLMHKEEGEGLLIISIFYKEENKITIEITDNGIGREKARELKSKSVVKHKSYGIQITAERLKHQYGDAFSMRFTDRYDDLRRAAGTTVTLHIPCTFTDEHANQNHHH